MEMVGIAAASPRAQKVRPSMFFGTALAAYLTSLRVDTVLVCGCTTSGCVRATVVDAFSYSYKTIVVEECTFDRSAVSHKVNLFDMHQKYADGTSSDWIGPAGDRQPAPVTKLVAATTP